MTSNAVIPADRGLLHGAGGAVLVAAAAALLLWLVSNVAPREWHVPDADIVLDGAHYRAGPDDLRWLESFTVAHFDAGEQAARALVADEVRAALDPLFAASRARLPEFLDWYYSLRGEYGRIGMAALDAADLAEPGYVARRAAATLLPEEAWTARLEDLEHAAAERLGAHYRDLESTWRREVTRRLSAQRVPAPLDAATGRPTLVLDDLVYEIIASEADALGVRLSLSTATAGIGAAAAPALARAVGRRAGRAAAGRAAARGASRIGAAAASGAAVCAPGGPVAAACAFLAGAGAWFATDWALLRVDEAMHRDELERALDLALTNLRGELERELVAAFDAAIAAHGAAVEREISRTFVPAEAGRVGVRDADGTSGSNGTRGTSRDPDV